MSEQDPQTIKSLVSGLSTLIGIVLLYFLPAITGRRKRNAEAIFVLNLLLGWTGLGWVAAMVWAVTVDDRESPQKVVVIQQPTRDQMRQQCIDQIRRL